MTHGKDIAQRTKTMFEPGYTEKVVNYCSGVAYTYRDAAGKPEGLVPLDGPEIGDRAPDVEFESGGRLFDRLRHPYFTLLAMAGDDNLAPVCGRLKNRFRSCLEVETLPASAALARRYGQSDGRLFLIRPDGYVAFKARAADAPRLEAWLDGTLIAHSD
jgi:hypothetical protein